MVAPLFLVKSNVLTRYRAFLSCPMYMPDTRGCDARDGTAAATTSHRREKNRAKKPALKEGLFCAVFSRRGLGGAAAGTPGPCAPRGVPFMFGRSPSLSRPEGTWFNSRFALLSFRCTCDRAQMNGMIHVIRCVGLGRARRSYC